MQHQDLGILERVTADTQGSVPAEVIAPWNKFPKEKCYSFLAGAAEMHNKPPPWFFIFSNFFTFS